MVMKQGKASDILVKSMFLIERNIIMPTKTRALVVAAEGIIRNSGEKNKAIKKKTATVSEVNPVRPPSAIPVVLST